MYWAVNGNDLSVKGLSPSTVTRPSAASVRPGRQCVHHRRAGLRGSARWHRDCCHTGSVALTFFHRPKPPRAVPVSDSDCVSCSEAQTSFTVAAPWPPGPGDRTNAPRPRPTAPGRLSPGVTARNAIMLKSPSDRSQPAASTGNVHACQSRYRCRVVALSFAGQSGQGTTASSQDSPQAQAATVTLKRLAGPCSTIT